MSTTAETFEVKVTLPRSVYNCITETAAREHQTIEEMLSSLVVEGLDAHMTAREILERVSEHYRARLAQAGKLDQPSSAVLEELRELREQVANELYP